MQWIAASEIRELKICVRFAVIHEQLVGESVFPVLVDIQETAWYAVWVNMIGKMGHFLKIVAKSYVLYAVNSFHLFIKEMILLNLLVWVKKNDVEGKVF